MKVYIIIIFISILCGCMSMHTDVSNHPKYSQFVGERYLLKQNMIIYGSRRPGSEGYFIIDYKVASSFYFTEEILLPGTILEIQGVKKSFFYDPLFFVKIDSYKKEFDYLISIYSDYILSSNIFERID